MSDLEKIGRFDVLERIGVGSFSVVYRGQDTFSKQPVAIKICIAQDESLRTGFLRLAEIAGRLRHPNIVSVLEFGSGDGKPYLVEEYVPSEHLGWRIEGDQPIPMATRMNFLHQIAEGLEYAHGQGVVHKHVAPRSIRILDERQAKITDFGIAQLSNATARLTDPNGSSRTDGYIAPEQALGLRADGRTDIFSFGALAYELLTYRKPFSAESLPDLFEQVLKGSGPADEDFSGISPPMADLIRRCLRRDPMERYPTVKALREDLSAISPPEESRNGQAAHFKPEETQAIPLEAVAHARSTEGKKGTEEEAEELGDQTIFADTFPPLLPSSPKSDDETVLAELPPPLPVSAEEPPALPSTLPATPSVVETAPIAKAEAATRSPDLPNPPPPQAREQEVSSGRTAWILVAAVVALLVVAYLGFHFLRSETPPEPPPMVVQSPSAPEPVKLAPTILHGFLVVDARPWGQVLRLLRPDGSEVVAPGDFTPLHLSLEPGTYFVELTHPEVKEPQKCEVEVVANTSARCWVEFTATTPTDYFKRAGWWR